MGTELTTRQRDYSFISSSYHETAFKDWPFARWLLEGTKKAPIKIWVFTVPCRGNRNTVLFSPKSLVQNQVLELLFWSPTSYPWYKTELGSYRCSGLQYWHCSLLTCCYLQHLVLVVLKNVGLWLIPCGCRGLFERTELCEFSLQSLSLDQSLCSESLSQ